MGRIKKITCIQLDGQFPDLGYRFLLPDYGLPLIATILSEAGYDVKVYVEHIGPPDWTRIADSDLICFSAFTSAAGKTQDLAEEIRSRHDVPIVMGGTHATYFPDTCLEYCDYVVLGEGDATIIDLVHTLSSGGDLDRVQGIAYKVGTIVKRTASRPGPVQFDTVPDFFNPRWLQKASKHRKYHYFRKEAARLRICRLRLICLWSRQRHAGNSACHREVCFGPQYLETAFLSYLGTLP